ncbi:MAG: TetR/AcrR family transcriptional regulator [Sandaracinus sp.]|nr:TetR/AcrR family transcriptional regulator [Myxococcales bacterium]MCB9604448.1 TetR/AcrR family transcriptional regulator [Sandaracinus sp.]MCB9615028.1 TetR/AcrR family transcriptional regulator [Sandaracinus sp.]
MPDASSSPPPPSLRDRILAAATRLFGERGYDSTSVREVAEAAGCTKPALYYHFGSKEALFLAALRAETDELTRLVERPLEPASTVRDHLIRALDAFFGHLRTDPVGVRLVMLADLRPVAGQPSFDFASIRERHLRQTQVVLEAGVARGEIRPDLRLDDAVYALTGLIDQRLQAWLQGEDLDADLPERLVSLFFHGVAS